ncbi:MAG: hypothetical protein NE327_09665 [Lentisphaeraceae bacterium]|nr:hypothetical protein [Lentisphaeraceae bacterium]
MKIFLLLITFSLSVYSQQDPFLAKVEELSKNVYSKIAQEANKLASTGNLEKAHTLYINAVPESQWKAEHYFFLGSVFFDMKPDLALSFQEHAFKLMPDHSTVMMEYGMNLMRKKDYKKANRLFRMYLKKKPDSPEANVYAAESSLYVNKFKDAYEFWQKAIHSRNHQKIDYAIFYVHGGLNVLQRHANLQAKIEKGDTSKITKILLLDLEWKPNWWSQTSRPDLFELDYNKYESKMDKNHAEDMAALAKLVTDKSMDRSAIKEFLGEKKLILGEGARLTKESIVALKMFQIIVQNRALRARELKNRFEEELTSRARSRKDPDALKALIYLNMSEEENLKDYYKMGWDLYKDSKLAGKYLELLAEEGKLDSGSQLLAMGLRQFPLDAYIHSLNIKLQEKRGRIKSLDIAKAIAAEFRTLSSFDEGNRNSYPLNGLFELLGENLK